MNSPQISLVGVYLRVSTEEQRERQSITTQRDFGQKYCKLHQLKVARIYADDGVSGTVPLEDRREGQQILTDARLRKFDQLLVYKLDRLGRDTRLIWNAVAELEKYGVRVRSMTEEFDTATASGRLMLTMLSGFAAHEREMIRERSIAGTNRVAEAGAWLGGIVPYGYRKEGDKSRARLVLANEPLPGSAFSEVEIIRSIYNMIAVERKSCRLVADHLNEIGVECAYTRDSRLLLRGKRKQMTSGLWRPSRVRNMIVSTTYMGRHEYGKRTTTVDRPLIVRDVPPIVPEELWNKAQAALKANCLFGPRNSLNLYLLRGIMKCHLCGLTYIGLAVTRPSGKREFYYRCNGKHGCRGLYGAKGQRCPSKDISGAYIEELIWRDIESFLRNPGDVLERLRMQINKGGRNSADQGNRIEDLRDRLGQKSIERDRVLALFRKGRINELSLNKQLDQVENEEGVLEAEIEKLAVPARTAKRAEETVASAKDLLTSLRSRLDGSISWEFKRQLVEILVGHIEIDTIERAGKRENELTVTYRFEPTVGNCKGTDYGRYQHEVRRETERHVRAGNGDGAVLERLPEQLENIAGKLRKLIEK